MDHDNGVTLMYVCLFLALGDGVGLFDYYIFTGGKNELGEGVRVSHFGSNPYLAQTTTGGHGNGAGREWDGKLRIECCLVGMQHGKAFWKHTGGQHLAFSLSARWAAAGAAVPSPVEVVCMSTTYHSALGREACIA